MNAATLSMIELSVKEALVRWEPRIEVLGVKAKSDYTASGRLEVAIDYSVRMTNNKYNLVYPFYLNEV
jgi:phage baseplate assembly protein W